MFENKTFGFIGGGQMAEAIISGMIHTGNINIKNIMVCDISGERLTMLNEKYGVQVAVNDETGMGAWRVAQGCDVLILALKPQYAPPVLQALAPSLSKGMLVISIIGGITLEALQNTLPGCALVRVMPNTPMLVGQGIAGIATGKGVTQGQTDLTMELFSLVGKAYLLDEKLIDPLTGISGCGPAFAYLFIEALSDGGVEKGLPRDMALQLAAQTLIGAGEMVLQTGKHPAQLKDSVTSPGGGTIVGVRALEEGGFRAAVINAVDKSVERMQEIGK